MTAQVQPTATALREYFPTDGSSRERPTWGKRGALPETTSAPELSPGLLPEGLRPWLCDVAERVSIPLAFVACPAIVALSAVVGRQVGMRPARQDDWTVIPNTWGMIVGRPGVMKSAAVSEALRPLRRLEAIADEQFEREKIEGEISAISNTSRADDAKDRIKAAIKASNKTDQLAAEADYRAAKGGESEPPTARRFLTSDSTVEKLGALLNENPRGLCVCRDELAGWLAQMDRQGNEGSREFFLEAWNGDGSFTYDRIGRGTLKIPALTLSIIGSAQPGKLVSLIDGAIAGNMGADGLLQRMQVVAWPDSPGEWREVDRWPDKDGRDRAFAIYQGLDQIDPAAIGAIKDEYGLVPYLRFADDAQELFSAWRRELEGRLRSNDLKTTPAFESHIAKYRSLLPSLALIFHLADTFAGFAGGPVSLEATKKAAAWTEFLEIHARKLYVRELSPGIPAAHAIADKISAGAITDGATIREISEHDWSGLKSAATIRQGLGVLAQAGWIRAEKTANNGRPSEIIRLHPEFRGGA